MEAKTKRFWACLLIRPCGETISWCQVEVYIRRNGLLKEPRMNQRPRQNEALNAKSRCGVLLMMTYFIKLDLLLCPPGSMFLPPTSAFGAGLYGVAMYGGLVLFSMFLLYDTQKIVKRAETTPMYGMQRFDPINR